MPTKHDSESKDGVRGEGTETRRDAVESGVLPGAEGAGSVADARPVAVAGRALRTKTGGYVLTLDWTEGGQCHRIAMAVGPGRPPADPFGIYQDGTTLWHTFEQDLSSHC